MKTIEKTLDELIDYVRKKARGPKYEPLWDAVLQVLCGFLYLEKKRPKDADTFFKTSAYYFEDKYKICQEKKHQEKKHEHYSY